MSKVKKIPKFKSASEENAFWQKQDSSDYIDWSMAKRASFPHLKPSTQTISLRLPEDLLNEIKILANKEDVPYQSLIENIISSSCKGASKINFFQIKKGNHMKRTFLSLLLSVSLSNTLASPTPHTWHQVSSQNGTWQATLKMINENGSFVSRDGLPLTTFTVSPNQAKEYGFVLNKGDDFDVAYTLTLTQNDSKNSFSSKACVFVITAAGPAQPDIRSESFHGAACGWRVVPGVGEDFTVE